MSFFNNLFEENHSFSYMVGLAPKNCNLNSIITQLHTHLLSFLIILYDLLTFYLDFKKIAPENDNICMLVLF